ncbi:MAG: hypothetical protein M3220_22680 [Chloroflexota bacterium]|nr:hypothetical protein [Chloroflexota bacterium]
MTNYDEEQGPEVQIERVGEAEEGRQTGKLGEEFKEFGNQLMRAVRAVADSEELRRLGNEITDSLKDIGEEIQETYEQTRRKEEVRAVGEQAKRVTRALTGREGAGDLQSSLSQALRSLNSELNKVIDQIQARSARMSEEVDSTARDATATTEVRAEEAEEQATEVAMRVKEQEMEEDFEEAMDATLDESAAESDMLDEGAIHEPGDDLERKWHEETQEGADLTDQEYGLGDEGIAEEGAEFPRATDARPREQKKNQPHYIGDKVDRTVERMQEEGTEMSDEAEALLEEGREELREIGDSPDEVG